MAVRIPLDYYRILGLPIQATAEQLKQAHRDRALQLPRREYSEAAIAARKQLLDEAYAVLSEPAQRQAYDASFLAKSYEPETISLPPTDSRVSDADYYAPSIDINDNQLIGALLILQELGEYELVLKLGRPYLSGNGLSSGRYGLPDIVRSDIVLTVAFACLELGREQWQQSQYENAAESLHMGQDLLLREGVFPTIRGEMQADLFKLRPYRILELLSLPEHEEAERQKGMVLLQDMLQDRGGIDGHGDDQSGLNTDDFLRFIQQLRSYLTSAEQQTLFEAEARRPSAVATYLAVYALLARGFAQCQPALIRRAKLMLVRLGNRQDVHLEQAVCALLLGQTEEASRALERSQEFESLAFIREHSQGSPDLLPGLCLYGEQWLQTEVFPHFRDLANRQASLKDYFADEQVQSYLEELPNEPDTAETWTSSASSNGNLYGRTAAGYGAYSRNAESVGQRGYAASATGSGATATLEASPRAVAGESATMPAAERISQTSSDARSNGSTVMPTSVGRSPRSSQSPSKRSGAAVRIPGMTAGSGGRRIFGRRSLRLDRLVFLLAMGVLSSGLLILLVRGLTAGGAGNAASQLTPLEPQFGSLIDGTVDPIREKMMTSGPLTVTQAQEVIESWLEIKAAANGQNHEVDKLSQILTEPILASKQEEAERYKEEQTYVEYTHAVKVTSVTPAADNPDQAEAIAEVKEAANYFVNSEPDTESSYDSTLQVRYTLVRQDNRWLIQEWVTE